MHQWKIIGLMVLSGLLLPTGLAHAWQLVPLNGVRVGPNGVMFRNGNEPYVDVDPIPDVSIASDSGALEVIQSALTPYLSPKPDSQRAGFELPTTYQNARQLQNDISQLIRNYGSSSTSGNNGYFITLSAASLEGYFTSIGTTSFLLQETANQRRTLFACQEKEQSQLILTSPSGYYLAITYGPGRKVHVVECDGDVFFNKRYRDISHLQLGDSQYYESRLQPIMQRFGLGAPVGGYSARARQVLGECLLQSEEEIQDFLTQYGEALMADDYQARQDATAQLKEQLEAQRVSVLTVILNPDQPSELRNLLLSLIKEQDPPLYETLNHSLIPEKMLDNPAFLTWMLREESLDESPDPALVQKLRERLSNLTGDASDTPLETWVEEQFGSIQAESFANVAQPESLPLMDLDGAELKSSLNQLLPITLVDGRLALDRQQWKEPYGDQTLQEHLNAVKQSMKEHHLPDGWLNPTVPNLSQDVYPMLLFQQMELVVPRDPMFQHLASMRQRRRMVGRSPGNVIHHSINTHYLELDMGEGQVTLEKSPFQFSWSILDGKDLSLVEVPGKSFLLTIQGYGDQQRLMIYNDAKKFQFQCIDGTNATNLTAESYGDFCERYPELSEQIAQGMQSSIKLDFPTAKAKTVEDAG